MIVTAFANKIILLFINLFASAFLVISECLEDYATYAGINLTNRNGILFFRASSKGVTLIESALKGDLVKLAIRVVLSTGAVNAVSILLSKSTKAMGAVLAATAVAAFSFLVIVLIRMLSRSLNISRAVYYTVMGLMAYIGVGIIYAYVAVHFEEAAYPVMTTVDIIVLPVSLLLGVLISRYLVKRGVRGYMGGFADAKAEDKEELV